MVGLDNKRFSKLVDELHNSFQAGKDNYPELLEATLYLLSNYQDHQTDGGRMVDDNGGLGHGANFAVTAKKLAKIRCYECNEFGHFKKDCPKLAASHVQHSSIGSTGNKTINPWTA